MATTGVHSDSDDDRETGDDSRMNPQLHKGLPVTIWVHQTIRPGYYPA